ncbi:MAG: hypothetical protein KGR69_11575 [Verrucomicrobia bacterium]|nr:hypothetical protein [Verrucomicrobiota bacterium]
MRTGQKIVFVRGNEPPLRCPHTALIAAALVSGARLAGEKPFLHTLEEVDGEPKRTTTWSVDGGGELVFRPGFPEERIDFAEFRKRFEDEAWCRSNPDHPIAYLRAFAETLDELRAQLRDQKPAFLLRKGKRFAVIPQDADPERKREILELLG